MKKYLLIGLFFFLASQGLYACINELLTAPTTGKNAIKRDFGPLLQIDSIPQNILFDHLKYLEQQQGDSFLLDVMNDMAVCYMRLSDAATAKNILLDIERKAPGNYSVAANLGTAYELLGNLDSALHWIKKAVTIDPKSHEGSEWIHVMILRYRIAKDKNPQYLSGSSALMLDFGAKDLPENPYGLNIAKLKDELAYQLKERLSFIAPPDTLMGMLLFDFANLVALSEDPGYSLWYYQAARNYGFESDLMDAREARIAEILADNPNAVLTSFKGEEVKTEGNGLHVYVIAGIIAVLAVAGVWLLLRKGRNNR